jgi:lipoprotein-releasing system ATP-binding protein
MPSGPGDVTTPHGSDGRSPPSDATRSAPLLLLEGVTKEYGGRVKTLALRGIDLRLDAGEFVALTGPSGSGKSTLLNIIGLLDRPTEGKLLFQGRDVASLDEAATTATRAHGIGFVFQFHHLLSAFTALENVMMPMLAERGRADAEMRKRASSLLAEVGLADRAAYPATNLSGGQQQRVAVARALVMQPPLVLADEPTGNLDSASAVQIIDLLLELHGKLGVTLVLVTHDPSVAERASRTVRMKDGQVISDQFSTTFQHAR